MDLADRCALHELAARYGDLIDERDWVGLAAIFTDDAVFDLSDVGAGQLQGLEAIRAHMHDARHPLAHLITNIYVDNGPPVRLCSRVIGVLDDRRVGSGTYRDRVVRTADGWRIAHREFTLLRVPRASRQDH